MLRETDFVIKINIFMLYIGIITAEKKYFDI